MLMNYDLYWRHIRVDSVFHHQTMTCRLQTSDGFELINKVRSNFTNFTSSLTSKHFNVQYQTLGFDVLA